MDWIKLILSFVKELFIPTAAYVAGKKSKELDQVKNENEKLKEYKKIDDETIQVSEVYDEKAWL